jgi:hypothetical protein
LTRHFNVHHHLVSANFDSYSDGLHVLILNFPHGGGPVAAEEPNPACTFSPPTDFVLALRTSKQQKAEDLTFTIFYLHPLTPLNHHAACELEIHPAMRWSHP